VTTGLFGAETGRPGFLFIPQKLVQYETPHCNYYEYDDQ